MIKTNLLDQHVTHATYGVMSSQVYQLNNVMMITHAIQSNLHSTTTTLFGPGGQSRHFNLTPTATQRQRSLQLVPTVKITSRNGQLINDRRTVYTTETPLLLLKVGQT